MTNYKICFYVPESHCEIVKEALFAVGAGRLGLYDCCAWQAKGEGQFRPLAGANPLLGQVDAIEKVAEIKVEMLCAADCIHAAINALKAAHPYEEPAYDVWVLADLK